MNKKAVLTSTVATLVIAIIVGVLILIVVGKIFVATGSSTFVDNMCQANAGIRNLLSDGTKRLMPIIFCGERKINVDGQDYSRCDPDNKFGFKNASDAKGCATQQLYDLAARCFNMFGADRWNLNAEESFHNSCFKVFVRGISNKKITEGDITEASKRADNCQALPTGDTGCAKTDGTDFSCAALTLPPIKSLEISNRENIWLCFDERGKVLADAVRFQGVPCEVLDVAKPPPCPELLT